MTGTISLAGVGVDAASEVAGGTAVTARPGHLTPLAVTRKSKTQIPRNNRKAANVCKKRLYIPRVHKTISVSNIVFLRPFQQTKIFPSLREAFSLCAGSSSEKPISSYLL